MIYGIYDIDGDGRYYLPLRLRAKCDRCGADIADPRDGEEGDNYLCYNCEEGWENGTGKV